MSPQRSPPVLCMRRHGAPAVNGPSRSRHRSGAPGQRLLRARSDAPWWAWGGRVCSGPVRGGQGHWTSRSDGTDTGSWRVLPASPKRLTFVDAADVAVDADDNVFVFCRGRFPVMIFDREGRFLDAWSGFGEGSFTFPHGLTVGHDGHVYTADSRDHTVRKWTPDGRLLLLTIGRPHQNAPSFSGEPFNRPTQVAVARNGDLYVSDGHTNIGAQSQAYGNARVHVFSADGVHRFSWGQPGSGPGAFETVHGVFIDPADDTVYVVDRFNDRIQRFALDGTYLDEWGGFRSATERAQGAGRAVLRRRAQPPRDHRRRDRRGRRAVGRRGRDRGRRGRPGEGAPDKVVHEPGPGMFGSPHGIAVDSHGSFYVADASESYAGLDRGARAVQKFVRV